MAYDYVISKTARAEFRDQALTLKKITVGASL